MIRTGRDEGDRVRLVVQHAGVGFDPQSLDRLFEAFDTTKNGGMGIGLPVSSQLSRAIMAVYGQPPNDGPGATFSFSIPRGPEGAAGTGNNRDIRTPAGTDAA
ncbi:MAG: ATP-binding protein [Terriglobales bacterium]